MQLVQTRMRLLAPAKVALTGRRFTFQRLRVVLFACEMLLPNCGPLPQMSHLAAMVLLQSWVRRVRGGLLQATTDAAEVRVAQSTGALYPGRRDGARTLFKHTTDAAWVVLPAAHSYACDRREQLREQRNTRQGVTYGVYCTSVCAELPLLSCT